VSNARLKNWCEALTKKISLVRSVRNAMSAGIQPKMIAKGSSGSYFARAKIEGRVQTVA
jgi:phosphatidylinositol 4-kinase type 2